MTNETKEKLARCVHCVVWVTTDAGGTAADCMGWGYVDELGQTIVVHSSSLFIGKKNSTSHPTITFEEVEGVIEGRNFDFVSADNILQIVPAGCSPQAIT